MIHRIYSNNKSFKAVDFTPGLNVIVADRTKESDEKDSRNGLGKTTLISIIHYCLGAELSKRILPVDQLKDWIFYIEIDLFDKKIIASRSIDEPGKIYFESAEFDSFPDKPEKTDDGKFYYTLSNWKKLLGVALFNIKDSDEKYSPTFRSIIPFFLRLGQDAYSSPFSYLRNQKSWQIQVYNAFLLGLNWIHASEVQELKDKNEALLALSKAIDTKLIASLGELEAERLRLQKDVREELKNLNEFIVHPKYREYEARADIISKYIQKVTNKNVVLNRKLNRYVKSIAAESKPPDDNLVSIYKKVGFTFNDAIKRTLEEAKDFHNKVISNRENFLKAEIREIDNLINDNREKIDKSSIELSSIMKLLEQHGALEDYTKFQQQLSEKNSELDNLKNKITEIKDIKQKKKEIKSLRLEIDSKLVRDYEECRDNWESAVSLFNEFSKFLYNSPGNLIINLPEDGKVKDKAYDFDVEIQRSGSEGVSKMKIFFYDLMLVESWSSRNGINFLVHDSTLFDGVDDRQVAHALELASQRTDKKYQYICTFNSDSLPFDDFSDSFNINDYVRLKLSDSEPEDCLLGFNFEV